MYSFTILAEETMGDEPMFSSGALMAEELTIIYTSIDTAHRATSDLGNITYKLQIDVIESEESIASVPITGIRCNEKLSHFLINLNHELDVHIKYLNVFIEDLYNAIDHNNPKIKNFLKIAALENAIIHETRHLYQFANWTIHRRDVDKCIDYDKKTYGYVFSNKKRLALETDANEYTLSKIEYTYLNDKKLKELYTRMEYNNIALYNYNAYNPDSINIKERRDQFVFYFDELVKYIKENY